MSNTAVEALELALTRLTELSYRVPDSFWNEDWVAVQTIIPEALAALRAESQDPRLPDRLKDDPWALQMLDYVDGLKSKSESDGWVSVTERLPDKDGAYNVAVDDGSVFSLLWVEREWCLWTADGLVTFDNITHWCPLPSPPKAT